MSHRVTHVVAGVVGAAAVIGLAGCGADSADPGATTTAGTTATGGGGGAGGSCGYGCSPCGECVKTACASAFAKCDGDPECPAYAACVLACPAGAAGDADPACVDACPTGTSSASKQAAAAVLACRTVGAGTSCAECHVTEHPPPKNALLNDTCGPTKETDPCFQCEEEKCCESQAACNAEPDCAAYKACFSACPAKDGSLDATCVYGCGTSHKNGANAFGGLYACMSYYCAIEQTVSRCDEAKRSPCQVCAFETCGDRSADLASAPGGFLLVRCIVTCAVGDEACDGACYAKYPAALDAYQRYGECIAAACPSCS